MPRPRIPQAKRDAIADAIRAGGKRNQIARDFDVGVGSVTLIAQENGLAFDRSETKRATEAKVADNKAFRAEVSREFLEKARDLLEQMDGEHLAFSFGGRDNTYREHKLAKPPPAELRNLIVSAAVAFDKHLAADRHDSDDQGLAAVDAWLRNMLGA